LIVHICDMDMLTAMMEELPLKEATSDWIRRYDALIDRFWPGPLTLLFPKPRGYLADEVTAGLDTVGIRMPNSPLALTLVKLSGTPIAAPSANSSTKPSPTTAAHVFHDLNGKIKYIVDGGPCDVGVESTVVDGLRDPPLVLRPGGVSIDEIRQCTGWENIQKGYKDESEIGDTAPRAPGMKYKHYSPKAKVILCENGFTPYPDATPGLKFYDSGEKPDTSKPDAPKPDPPKSPISLLTVGIIRTNHWKKWIGWDGKDLESTKQPNSAEIKPGVSILSGTIASSASFQVRPSSDVNAGSNKIVLQGKGGDNVQSHLQNLTVKEVSTDYAMDTDDIDSLGGIGSSKSEATKLAVSAPKLEYQTGNLFNKQGNESFDLRLIDVEIGPDPKQVASWLFAVLREMDQRGADVIYVEGIADDGSIAAAVMNRLRKAATERWGIDLSKGYYQRT
jgi:tRNA threonylcarbamoyl adenosine modification protein (Sua5/YciO/YrdC/YwlC family)